MDRLLQELRIEVEEVRELYYLSQKYERMNPWLTRYFSNYYDYVCQIYTTLKEAG